MVHDEHWLGLFSDLQVVLLVEIFGDADLGAISQLKESRARALIESDVFDDVSPLRSVVCDDARVCELCSARILEPIYHPLLIVALEALFYLIIDGLDFIQDRLG